MQHSDNAFATMLLMSQLSADREEIVRPLSAAEFYALRERAAECGMKNLGELIDMDLSAVRMALKLEENEAYRVCVLMNRVMPLSYALERFAEAGIDFVTLEEENYPARLSERLGRKAPPMVYACGDLSLAAETSITLAASSCSRPDTIGCARELAAMACEAGVTMITGGESGFGRLIEREALQGNGRMVTFLAESLCERICQSGLSEMIATGRAVAMSIIHPEAKYTVSHALDRNKCLYALGNAAFVITCEKGRGTTWEGASSALRNGYTDRIYVWENEDIPGNMELIARGATPFRSPQDIRFRELKAAWEKPAYEQLSLF